MYDNDYIWYLNVLIFFGICFAAAVLWHIIGG